MRKLLWVMLVCMCLTSCVVHEYTPRPYLPNYNRTYVDRSAYRPSHYRNFGNTDYSRRNTAARAGDDLYRANTYVDTHAETGKPVYHTTYTTSYNSNGEVTTTYTTDYAGSKKEKQYYKDVRKEQKKAYKQSRKRK